MLKRVALIAVLVLLFVPSVVKADSVLGGGTWLSGWAPSNSGNPYWANTSYDPNSTAANIGFCMTGGIGCTMLSGAPGALPTWVGNTTTGAAANNFWFTNANATSPVGAVMQVEIAGYAAGNVFGWVATTATGALAGPLNVLFPGAAGAGSTVTFSLGSATHYAFWLLTPTGNLFFTTSGANMNSTGGSAFTTEQHFALFAPNTNNVNSVFYLGMEDTQFGALPAAAGADRDYNDMVVKITHVPEPGTLALFGTGLLGIAGVIRRRLKI